jgi:hypothetical protein
VLTKTIREFGGRPGAEARLNQLAFFVRLKPHAPSGKATTGFVIKLNAGSCLYPTSTISRSLARSLAPFAGTNLPTLPSPNGGIPL